MDGTRSGRHRPQTWTAVLGSLATIGGLLGVVAAVDQFVTGHGVAIAAGIVSVVFFTLVLVGAWRARPSAARRVLAVISVAFMLGSISLIVVSANSAKSTNSLSLTVQRDTDSCATYFFDAPISKIGPPPEGDQFDRVFAQWAQGHDGIEANPMGYTTQSRVLITVVGTSPRPVIITGLRFFIQNRRPTGTAGSVVSRDCGDATVARYAEVDVDHEPAKMISSSATTATWGDTSEAVAPLQFPYRVTDADSETLLIMIDTNGYAEWKAQLDYTDGHTIGQWAIDDRGKPFRASAVGAGSVHYIPDAGRWDPS